MICPYQPCGSHTSCIGCMYDPQGRKMTFEQFDEQNHRVTCGDCKFCNPSADLDSVESTCKRLDHKHIKFAVPYFKSYDCGQLSGFLCSDFQPKESCRWLHRHWQPEFIHEKAKQREGGTIALCLDGDTSIRYYVDGMDFFYGRFVENGELKWIKKQYYKRSKESTIGYKLITERNLKKDKAMA